MNTEILFDHEPVADGGYVVRTLLRLTGEAPEAGARPPLDLALVLDRSGSMGALGKLDRAKEAAALLVQHLRPDDTLSLVTYDDQVQTLAPRAGGAHKDTLLARIQGIPLGGTTNLSGGWLRGRDLVARGLDAAGPGRDALRRVLLMTDGLANVGITDPDTLAGLTRSAAEHGVSTTTIGFGQDYDEHLLRAMADAGRGSTYYIEAPDQAPAVFQAEIEGLMALAAQNVAVTVTPAPGVQLVAVHHRYPSVPQDDGSLRLELGDLFALEPRSLLVEFLTSDDDAAQVDVATLTLEAHVLLPGGGVEKRTLTLPLTVSRGGGAVRDPVVRRELLLLEAARAREEALHDRADGRFDVAARKLRTVAEQLAPYGDADPDLADERDDLRDMAERFDTEQVTAADAKWMYQRAYSRSTSKLEAMRSVREDRREERERRRARRRGGSGRD